MDVAKIPVLYASLALLAVSLGGCEQQHTLTEVTVTSIGPQGGEAVSADGVLLLKIPAGALAEVTQITIAVEQRESQEEPLSRFYSVEPQIELMVQGQLRMRETAPVHGRLVVGDFAREPPVYLWETHYVLGNNLYQAPLWRLSTFAALVHQYQPCVSKVCGESCRVCPPEGESCGEAGEYRCSADSQCIKGAPSCDSVYDPCADLECGDTCLLCDPLDVSCESDGITRRCSATGACQGGAVDCSSDYDPCAEKSCGEECQLCPPLDINCVEPMVLKYCSLSGACSGVLPDC